MGVELWGHNRPRFDDNWNSRGDSSAPGHFLHYDEDGPHFRGSGEWMSGPSRISVGHCAFANARSLQAPYVHSFGLLVGRWWSFYHSESNSNQHACETRLGDSAKLRAGGPVPIVPPAWFVKPGFCCCKNDNLTKKSGLRGFARDASEQRWSRRW